MNPSIKRNVPDYVDCAHKNCEETCVVIINGGSNCFTCGNEFGLCQSHYLEFIEELIKGVRLLSKGDHK